MKKRKILSTKRIILENKFYRKIKEICCWNEKTGYKQNIIIVNFI